MSDSNLAKIAYQEEEHLGVTPTPPTLRKLRYTAETLASTKETVSSSEIRPDRQVPDLTKVGLSPQGGFNFELSYAALQPFLAAVLHSDWVDLAVTATCDITASTGLVDGTAGDFDDYLVGAFVKVSGAGTTENNGYKKVTAVAADGSSINLTGLTTDESAVELTFAGKAVTNGYDRKSYTFEKAIRASNGEDFFQVFRGMTPDTMELTIQSRQIITGTMGFMGLSYEPGDDSIQNSSTDSVSATGTLTMTTVPLDGTTVTIDGYVLTYRDAPSEDGEVEIGADTEETLDNLADAIATVEPFPQIVTADVPTSTTLVLTAVPAGEAGNDITTTTDAVDSAFGDSTLTGGVTPVTDYGAQLTGRVMNGNNNFGSLEIDGSKADGHFRQIRLNFANNVRGKDALGVEGYFDTGLGQLAVTGSITAYFKNNELPNRITDHTPTGISFHVQDPDGARFYFNFPQAFIGPGDPRVTGVNADVMIEADFNAVLDPASDRTLVISALDA